MDEKGYVGLKITPMQEFWVDCYTTAVYSMLLTCNKIDKEYIYNNRYVYFHDVNEKKNLGRIYIKTRTQEVADELLTEKEEHDFVSDDHFAESMKKYIDAGVSKVLCTEISKDGTLAGPAIDLYKQIMAEFPDMHLIASGGVSCIEDIEALDKAGIPAVVFGKAIYEGKIKMEELAKFI